MQQRWLKPWEIYLMPYAVVIEVVITDKSHVNTIRENKVLHVMEKEHVLAWDARDILV